MKSYSVKELAKLSGVSVRTLHYYDEIDLLKPSVRTDAGYRFYGEAELLRLQQVLFYRELDFPLKEIIELLDDEHFDILGALENHRSALQTRGRRIEELLSTIDKTIQHVKQGDIMKKPEILYEGLPKEAGTTWRDEAIEKYGQDAIDQSETELLKLGKEGFEELKKEMTELGALLYSLRGKDPESTEVQSVIAKHYSMIRKFWGTYTQKDKQAAAYAGLGQLYVSDERFTMVDGKSQPEYAHFMQQAMKYYADTQLS